MAARFLTLAQRHTNQTGVAPGFAGGNLTKRRAPGLCPHPSFVSGMIFPVSRATNLSSLGGAILDCRGHSGFRIGVRRKRVLKDHFPRGISYLDIGKGMKTLEPH